MQTTRTLAALAAAATLALLAACGAGTEAAVDTTGANATRASATPVQPTLLDDEGRVQVLAAAHAPADPGARTRAGRYATPEQAAALEGALGTRVISTRVEAGAPATDAADMAVLTVYGMQAVTDADNHVPVLVRGADLRLAATVADRLEEAGFTRVFLVTP